MNTQETTSKMCEQRCNNLWEFFLSRDNGNAAKVACIESELTETILGRPQTEAELSSYRQALSTGYSNDIVALYNKEINRNQVGLRSVQDRMAVNNYRMAECDRQLGLVQRGK